MNTTVGRVILNDHLPEGMPFINGLLKKKGIGQLVNYCYLRFGLEVTVKMLDEVKDARLPLRDHAPASRSASTTWSSRTTRRRLVNDAEKQVVDVQQQYLDGAITNGERYNKVIEIWSAVTEKVADEMFGSMQERDKEGAHQPDLHHGRLRRSRIETADPPALRYARTDGQAVGRNHRDPDHGQLPRRPDRAAVLHLDARRP